jgi:hypothetical protein
MDLSVKGQPCFSNMALDLIMDHAVSKHKYDTCDCY